MPHRLARIIECHYDTHHTAWCGPEFLCRPLIRHVLHPRFVWYDQSIGATCPHINTVHPPQPTVCRMPATTDTTRDTPIRLRAHARRANIMPTSPIAYHIHTRPASHLTHLPASCVQACRIPAREGVGEGNFPRNFLINWRFYIFGEDTIYPTNKSLFSRQVKAAPRFRDKMPCQLARARLLWADGQGQSGPASLLPAAS